jgi:heme-degrading monooxygenase HmoA
VIPALRNDGARELSDTSIEEVCSMVTVVTHVRVKEGRGPDWDRVNAATGKQGFVVVQLCRPRDSDRERVIVGTWQRQEDWEAWHHDPEFVETRRELEETADVTDDSQWYDVIVASRD